MRRQDTHRPIPFFFSATTTMMHARAPNLSTLLPEPFLAVCTRVGWICCERLLNGVQYERQLRQALVAAGWDINTRVVRCFAITAQGERFKSSGIPVQKKPNDTFACVVFMVEEPQDGPFEATHVAARIRAARRLVEAGLWDPHAHYLLKIIHPPSEGRKSPPLPSFHDLDIGRAYVEALLQVIPVCFTNCNLDGDRVELTLSQQDLFKLFDSVNFSPPMLDASWCACTGPVTLANVVFGPKPMDKPDSRRILCEDFTAIFASVGRQFKFDRVPIEKSDDLGLLMRPTHITKTWCSLAAILQTSGLPADTLPLRIIHTLLALDTQLTRAAQARETWIPQTVSPWQAVVTREQRMLVGFTRTGPATDSWNGPLHDSDAMCWMAYFGAARNALSVIPSGSKSNWLGKCRVIYINDREINYSYACSEEERRIFLETAGWRGYSLENISNLDMVYQLINFAPARWTRSFVIQTAYQLALSLHMQS